MNCLEIYNELQKRLTGATVVEKEDILKAIGEENFILLVRNFMITLDHKDENGVWWYLL